MDIPAGIVDMCPNALEGASAQLFMTLINALFAAKCKLDTQHMYPKDFAPYLQDDEEFDFIVVGAGSAGSVVASHLSEIAHWKILLIEAGGYPSATSEIPALFFHVAGSKEDWGYQMEASSSYCAGLRNNGCHCPRGKGLGGSSLLNAQMYVRSTRYDHEQWVNDGNIGWDYDTVIQYYKNIENVQIDYDNYGKHGNLNISNSVFNKLVLKSFGDIYKELGYSEYTDDKPIGYKPNLLTISEGSRQNVAKAFLTKAKNRPNLYVSLNSQVGKLLFNENKDTVTGVEVKIGNQIRRFHAKKEVILSAGSINSPFIMMNSGIGPKQQLTEFGIDVLRDLKVGENFQDHSLYPAFFIEVHSPDLQPRPPLGAIDDIYQYIVHQKGPFDMTDYILTGYVNTLNKTDRSNLQIIALAFNQQDERRIQGFSRGFMLPQHVEDKVTYHNKISGTLVFMLVGLNPKSRGYVRLQNNDPFSRPIIIPNFLSDENKEDIEVLKNAIKITKQIIKTKTFSQFFPKYIDLDIPNCQQLVSDSDGYWECAIRNLGQTLYHPVGTCKMGPSTDPTAVVGPNLKVHGVDGIRIIDGSIMPTVTSGNTNAPIIMIGARGAQLIKDGWLHRRDEL